MSYELNAIKNLDVPVLFLFFNRPDLTKVVFEKIRLAKPKVLYLVSDGGRNSDENVLVNNIRDYVDRNIDWTCEVHRDYASTNLGCKVRVSSGISFALKNEPYVIVLEDDCVPELEFFFFCEHLLKKYLNDNRIMAICGNYNIPGYNVEESYLFSRFVNIWGWATWQRAWVLYDVNMRSYCKNGSEILRWLPPRFREAKIEEIEQVLYDGLDTWDFQWQYCIWEHNGLCIKPSKNMVRNIGFDERATHTYSKPEHLDRLDYSGIQFPLVYSSRIDYNIDYDDKYISLVENKMRPAIWYRIKRIKRRIFGLINKRIR